MKSVTIIILTLALCASGCGSSQGPLRIGAKPFAEQTILAEMLRHLVMEIDLETEIVNCSDSFECQRRLREGDLDLMVEYSGTALQFVGSPPPEREAPVAQARRLYEPLGIHWLEPLGFDNNYCILVPVNQGATQGIESIGDLAGLTDGVRVATPPEFLRRARDGLQAMVRFYGLRLAEDPLVINDPIERYHALREGRVDIAIGYTTDGSISSLGLTALTDPQEFFPPYQAAIVVRQEIIDAHSELEEKLDILAGQMSTEVMQGLNSAVQVDGDAAEAVALRFLEEQDILEEEHGDYTIKRVPPIVVGYTKQDALDPEMARALRAVRHLFPDRPVKRVTYFSDPIMSVETGRAHFAVVSAERFFSKRRRHPPFVEAVAVLGTRFVHLISHENREGGDPLQGRIGIQPEESSGGIIGETILSAMGSDATAREETASLLAKVRSGDLDGALVVAELGARELARPLSHSELRLSSVGSWLSPRRAVAIPYLRRARIPSGTYTNQFEQIETLSVQVVLVTPSRNRPPSTGAAGPAAALPIPMRPLTSTQLDRLSEATGILEVPDAVLPSLWTRRFDESADEDRGSLGILETVLNVIVIVFLAWVVLLILRRPKPDAMIKDKSS